MKETPRGGETWHEFKKNFFFFLKNLLGEKLLKHFPFWFLRNSGQEAASINIVFEIVGFTCLLGRSWCQQADMQWGVTAVPFAEQ